MSVTPEYLPQGTATTLLSTELNSLANNTFSSAGSAQNNVQATSNFNGYPYARLVFSLAAPSGAFAANSALYFWFLRSIDGSTYEDGSTTTRPPDVVIPLRTDGSAQVTEVDVQLPFGNWKPIAENVQGSGSQALASTTNTVKVLPFTVQGT